MFGRLSYPLEAVELGPSGAIVRDGYRIEPFAVEHGVPAIGYALVEDERPGYFDVEVGDGARSPGRPGARGSAARIARHLPRGTTVTPDQVLGPARAGRRSSSPGTPLRDASVVDAAAGAELLVHEATFLADERERARETLHSTAGEAALVAREAGVRMLALTHLSTRYFGHEVQDEARELFPDGGGAARLRRRRDPAPGTGRPGARPLGSPRGEGCARVRGDVTRLVQVAVAGDVTEAEEIRDMLASAGIESELEMAVEHDPGTLDDPPLDVLVSELEVDAARDGSNRSPTTTSRSRSNARLHGR